MSFYGSIAGRLTKDAELKQFGEKAVVKMRLAWDTYRKGEKVPQFIDAEMWGPRGEAVARFLNKGTQVAVHGEITSREYEGKTYWTLDAKGLDLMGGGKAAGGDAPAPEPEEWDGEEVPFS